MTELRKINTVITKRIITVRLLKIDEHEKNLRLEVYKNLKEEIIKHIDYKYYNISNLLIWLTTYRNLMINTYKEIKDKDYYIKSYMIEEAIIEIMKLEREYLQEV